MPSRKSLKNGKKKTKSRGRKQSCRTLRCKTGRRVNSKGYFRKKTKRKSRKTKGGGMEGDNGDLKQPFHGEVKFEIILKAKDDDDDDVKITINGTWMEGKLIIGDITRDNKIYGKLNMKLRNEMGLIADSSLETYYIIEDNQGKELHEDDDEEKKTLKLVEENLSDLFFKEGAFKYGLSNKLLKEYGGKEDS